jgi:hypothetical protein
MFRQRVIYNPGQSLISPSALRSWLESPVVLLLSADDATWLFLGKGPYLS